ncbi:fimbrial biogenesis chaperone [Proteus mirabilis]|uniref:fimbrial biogenesis chaperone n=1 Tax=Proteus mirabilis TaxID=584 RepID=UPI00201617C1|nr:fimbria/pilus periplasmic chaperone [Proteus mirabilis]MDC9788169.1 fimbria/pilus periplasmic chaperone [Proteus mirabilis]
MMTWSTYAGCLMALLLSGSVQAGLVINGTQVVYPSEAGEVTVQITNNGKRAVLVQSWLDTGNKDETPDKITTPFALTPPINRVEAGKGQSLRISAINTSVLRQDRESLFWLNVLEIPGRPDKSGAQENYLQLAVRSRIKFFYRPASLKDDIVKAPTQLIWSATNKGLTVTNPTPYHISLATIVVGNKTMDVDMVSPQDNRTFEQIKVPKGSTIVASWIDDYGSIRSENFIVK